MPARDETWQVVMPADDLWEGELTGVRLGAKNIVLLNAGARSGPSRTAVPTWVSSSARATLTGAR